MLRRHCLILTIGLTLAGCAEEQQPTEQRAPQPPSAIAPRSSAVAEPRELAEQFATPAPETTAPTYIAPLMPRSSLSGPSRPETGARTALGPSSAAPPAATSPYWKVKVFYGTNRSATGSWQPDRFYSGRLGDLSLGSCDVSIPLNHERGQLESPRLWKLELREDPEKHVSLLHVQPQTRSDFMREMQQAVWSSMRCSTSPEGPMMFGGEAFIFVHGYSNSFEDAARRTAQIAYDLDFQGAPILFSWPSKGKWSIESYRDDGRAASSSRQGLVEFVRLVVRESGARRIHFIAHSMGNRVVTEALAELARDASGVAIPKFNEVILTAPDIDAREFKEAIAPHITQAAERITIYSSSSDRALQASAWLNTLNRPRLGEGGRRLTVFPEYTNIDVIDATSVATDLFGFNHSYHAENPSVLTDIELVLAGLSAEQRGLGPILNQLAWQIRNWGQQVGNGVRSVGGVRP